jgi:hypothetical protein
MLSYFKCRNIPVDLGVAEWLHSEEACM